MMNIWADRKISDNQCAITFYAKPETTWEQIHKWFEAEYDDKHWKIICIGEEGNDAQAILFRRPCNCCNEDSDENI
jgi:serine protease inhibitor